MNNEMRTRWLALLAMIVGAVLLIVPYSRSLPLTVEGVRRFGGETAAVRAVGLILLAVGAYFSYGTVKHR